MLIGILFALGAGLLWGLIFIGPLLVPDYPATLLSAGRYVAFGMIAVALAWHDRHRLRRLSRGDWIEAFRLTLVGNLMYYTFLSAAIQRTGAPVSTMLIGTLPVVMTITSNLLYGRQEGRLAWSKLMPALLLIIIGLCCVNVAELDGAARQVDLGRYLSGIFLALLAVVCWTWYPLRNARWLRANPDKKPGTWATAQGIATLPLALLAWLLVALMLTWTKPDFALPFGPQPQVFILLMLAIGLFCSWIGTLCWNEACQRLPTVLVGPLIVFETLAGLAYTFMLRQSWPPVLTLAGIACLIIGVLIAIRIKPQPIVNSLDVSP